MYLIERFLPLPIRKVFTIVGNISIACLINYGRSQFKVVDAVREQHQRSGQLQNIHRNYFVTVFCFLWKIINFISLIYLA